MMEGSIPSSSSFSTPTPTSSSSPAASHVFRPRRSEDWNRYRPVIEQLYRDDQLKLRDVKRIMEREHKFVASEKQYKDRLAAWNIRKNIKAKEISIMVRKQRKRAAKGKQTVFRVAGQKVDHKRIARFVRRYGPNVDSSEPRPTEPLRDSPEPATPSDMSYYTPPPDERALTLSPNPDNHHSYDNLDSLPDSEMDETKSPSSTFSPASTYDSLTAFETLPPVAEGTPAFGDLGLFQKKMEFLGEKLDKDSARFFAVDESRYPHN
ncbi:Clr5 domain-containing protein [Aspergillus karnatakaensis]|uniref:Clr5 domain-containing protein n=1 Tax=Aspergillus karnatakaensis TaxID=1810916 RepID=UPI003CCD0175